LPSFVPDWGALVSFRGSSEPHREPPRRTASHLLAGFGKASKKLLRSIAVSLLLAQTFSSSHFITGTHTPSYAVRVPHRSMPQNLLLSHCLLRSPPLAHRRATRWLTSRRLPSARLN